MDSSNITNAFIQPLDDFSETNLKISLSKVKGLTENQNLLVIQSTIENSIKLSIYPIFKDKITKVSLYGLKLSKKVLKEISKILQKFQVIHASGFLKIKKQLFYECYLNLNLSEKKGSAELKSSLDKIKNVFQHVKIEEIGIKNR
ncbi:MAG: hypothetical protein ACFE8N_03215 [Promethearchaeota archaeon]